MTKPKLCFQMIVFNSDYVLDACLESISRIAPLVVTEGPCGYWKQQGCITSTDDTNKILDYYRDNIIGIVRGQFPEKDEMVRASSHLIPDDTTHVVVLDSDEIFRHEDWDRILELLEERDCDSMGFTTNGFFGGFDYILGGFERRAEYIRIQRWYPGARWHTHRPPTILSHNGIPWAKTPGHIGKAQTEAAGIYLNHYTYVFPSQVEMKHIYYSHYRPEITIQDYPNSVFLPWVNGNKTEREQIERLWSGVHNFVPHYRRDCYPMAFTGEHPEEIVKRMPEYTARLRKELLDR